MERKIIVLLVCLLCVVGCSSTTTPKTPKKEEVVENKQYQYYYDKASKKDKKNYEILYQGILKHEKSINFKKMTEDKMLEILTYVRSDHPELFWVEPEIKYMQANEGKSMIFYPKYNSTKKEIKQLKKQLKEVSAQIIAGIQADNDYDKVQAVYEYAIQNFEYVDNSENNQNILSALLNKQTVCAGYAKAVQYLLLEMGIENTVIEGHTVEEPNSEIGHAWNMVKLNNDYYYFDATWGDVVEYLPHTCYGFFLMSDVEMLKAYIPDYAYEPTANVNETWFMRKGQYMTSWDSQSISNLWIEAINAGRNYIEIKCSPEAYADFKWRIAESQEMYTILDNLGVNIDGYNYIEKPQLSIFDIYY